MNKVRHKAAVLREQIIGDVIGASKGETENERLLQQAAARVVKLGGIDHPGEALLAKLPTADFRAITRALGEMDKELEASEPQEGGAVKKPEEEI